MYKVPATIVTSRGCPSKCIFCAAEATNGAKVRLRSAENVLAELDWLHERFGMREIIYLDDHFLFSKKRALAIMKGIVDREYGLTWKCGNVAVFSLDSEILEWKRRSGCSQLTLSIESGVEETLKIIGKPVDLKKTREIVFLARSMGFEVVSNFVIGFPGETWDNIRRTVEYAESLNLDMVSFHVAMPLPKTRLWDLCIQQGLIDEKEENLIGYCRGLISTPEFSSAELQILRTFEWDRINFKTPEKRQTIARMLGITPEEMERWRRETRKNLGAITNWEKLDRKSTRLNSSH
jgi:MoaA/NifB/PqqE/SkfB family radical SAM enzyme